MNKKTRHIVTILFLLILKQAAISQIISTPKIEASIENSRLLQLKNRLTATTWSVNQDSLYLFKVSPEAVKNKIQTQFYAQADDLGQIKLTLSFKNNSTQAVKITTVFPNISGLYYPSGSSSDLYYLYPEEGLAHHNSNFKREQIYSRWFPLQFIDVYNKTKGGFYVMTNDTTNYPKKYFFEKSSDKTNIKVTFNTKEIKPGETWELPPVVIGAHEGDWHDAFFAYRNWVRTWYKPLSPRKTWFQDIYNFRQIFLHTVFGEPGIWHPLTKEINLLSRIEEDKEVFGGVDYVHIFDWMREPEDRIFNYKPWNYLGGYESLKSQIETLKNQGIKTGLYYQGYKLNRQSEIGLLNGNEWQMLNPSGLEYGETGYYYPCPSSSGWQDYFSQLAAETTSLLNVDGIYYDQYGFGYLTNNYGCYNPLHEHPIIEGSVSSNYMGIGETQMLEKTRNKVGNEKVIYVEEMPTDVSTQYLDGSFTYAINKSKFSTGTRMNPSSLNLFRFAFPGFKTFELLQVDNPVGEDTIGVKNIFFNGEGIWIEGPLNDSGWFPESVRKLIRKTHTILSNNKEAFRSEDAIPLVPTLNPNVHSNYFPSSRKNIWTFLNISNTQHNGTILQVPHIPGALYYDGWNFKQIFPTIVDNNIAIINLQINEKDAGCLIQTLDPLNMVLPIDPPVEEKTPELSIQMKTTLSSGSNMSFRLSAGGTGSVYVDWGNGDLIEYVGDMMSSNVNSPTTLSSNISIDADTIKIYTKNRYITYLDCSNNKLSYLDVSKAPMIQYLRCYTNNLTELNVENNLELILLQCYSNQLTNLDVSNSIKLAQLLCNANKISNLNLTGLEILNTLSVMNNPLKNIDLSTNRSLQVLNLRNTQLTSLDLSMNPLISSIDIFNSGPTNVNDFSACALDSLFLSLPDRNSTTTGVIKVIYAINNPLGNDAEGSNKTIANNKNWEIRSSVDEILTGDGEKCIETNLLYSYLYSFECLPNPADNYVKIKISGNVEKTNLYLYDITGKLVLKDVILSEKTLNTSQLEQGVYFIKMGSYVDKLMIKR